MSKEKQIKSSNWLIKGYTDKKLAEMKEKAIKEAETELCNKQIEEMVCNACITKPTCTDMEKAKCMRRNFAICVIKQGYRKASDVAREIITEFANMLKCHSFYMTDNYGEVNENMVTVKAISEVEAELKKKYESEGEKNNEI